MTRVIDHKFILSLLILALVALSACSFLDALPFSSLLSRATETPTPTNTLVPTRTSTRTPLPPTPTPIPDTPTPTETKVPTARPTRQVTITRVPSATLPILSDLPEYQCDIYSQTPVNNTIFPPNEAFDGRWVVKNTGSKTWKPDDIAFQYISGTEFHRTTGSFLLPKDIKPGLTADLLIDMHVPMEQGDYKALWGMVMAETTGDIICAVEVNFSVR